MLYLYFLLFLIAFYLAIVILTALFVVPFMGFHKHYPPEKIPDEMREVIKKLELESPDQMAYLKASFNFMRSRWHSERLRTIIRFPLIFRTDIGKIWKSPGYAHCTTINFILFSLLVKSKFFKEDDVKFKETFFNMVLHQYLQVRVGDKWIDSDASVTYLRLPLGKRAYFFG